MSALADWLANLAMPWIDFYADSMAAEAAVMFLHLGGIVAAGGIAFTLDRAVLRAGRGGWPRRPDLARELHESHVAVLIGLAAVFVSGIALTMADPTIFLVSWVYWAKMFAVALLLLNGFFLKRAGDRLLAEPEDDVAFRGLRTAAIRSGALWGLTVLGGVAVTLYA
ncbi:MAG: hypothetical protein PVJ80_06480 [Gemmatimonadota bacterium]|jgi:hypothetical protein